MNGKRTLIFIVASIVTICIFIGFLKGYNAIWSIWKIPTMTPHFGDLRNLTGGAESISKGYDPLYFNPQDPWGRPMNQPRFIQYILVLLKINQYHTTFIGILFILLFFLGIFISLKEIDNTTAIVLAFVVFSPAIVLGIERANHDLLVYFLVSLALFISRYPLISMFILLLASFIKLFPVFALPYFFKYTKKTQIVIFSIFLLSFLLYFFLNSSDWVQIFRSTQKGHGVWAYGIRTYSTSSNSTSYIPFAAIIIGPLTFYINSIYAHGFKKGNDNYIDTFRAGAGIYLGSFFLGNNWAYRLMFLILVIPQLVSWRNDTKRRFISLIALISAMISCWSMLSSHQLMITVDEISNWILFQTLFYLLISSMPLIGVTTEKLN
jgi:hypothetical protein